MTHERGVLSAVRYQPNVAVLHTDTNLLPRRPRVWSAWNYLGSRGVDGTHPVCVSYLVNQLQPLPFKHAARRHAQSGDAAGAGH